MDSLEEIGQRVRTCTDCALSASRTHGVPGEGPGDAEIIFIGEGPGYHEDRLGRPFVGPAGSSWTSSWLPWASAATRSLSLTW